ncbi:DNA/RNA nuclease SfsA [Aminipila luticellarii]|uniref:Sugar fermentation stimulation protein homolog n=1 Tax=Aminipila luticellarii TaxID=2507160 RepID=A0A410PVP0_9FIRM|nr:DNA/RNA nuclease SfsA [Aminipila luticellarii]QAT43011.1 DNA/RNA nuclease SfsA [Aminipila luticellarii]
MIYNNIKPATFISRPNRFIANIEIGGKREICHVKNTGRCREFLTEGARVFVQESDNMARKTKYDLISVYKGDRLINMDSQVTNKVVQEWLEGGLLFEDIVLIKPESRYKNSRFDFYVETEKQKIYIEVKGVTLEENGVVLFPDAPTERGVKHLRELAECLKEGFEAYVIFVVQMADVKVFKANARTHKAFDETLRQAYEEGVKVMAYECSVTPGSITMTKPVPVLIGCETNLEK